MKVRSHAAPLLNAALEQSLLVLHLRMMSTEKFKAVRKFSELKVGAYVDKYSTVFGSCEVVKFLGIGVNSGSVIHLAESGNKQKRIEIFVAMICECLGTDDLKLSLAKLFREIAPVTYVAYVLATLQREHIAPGKGTYRSLLTRNFHNSTCVLYICLGWQHDKNNGEHKIVVPLVSMLSKQISLAKQIDFFQSPTNGATSCLIEVDLPRRDKDEVLRQLTVDDDEKDAEVDLSDMSDV